MSNSNKNFLILGHTGVGKSQLINYLFGQQVAKTGAGRPVTQKGNWQKVQIHSPFTNNETFTFFDSWGLESNKADSWKQKISQKLTSSWDENMICGIIYCFSYAHRIQEFELNIISHLLSLEYKTLIVLTNADCRNHKELQPAYFARINEQLSSYQGKYEITEICSIEIKKLGGRKEQPFGKEKLFSILLSQTTDNILRIFNKNFANLKKEINAILDDASKIDKYSDSKFIDLFKFLKLKNLFTNNSSEKYNNILTDITNKIKNRITEFGFVYQKTFGHLLISEPNLWDKVQFVLFTDIRDIHRSKFYNNLKILKKTLNRDLDTIRNNKIAEMQRWYQI